MCYQSPMLEPSRRSSRLAIAGAAIAAIALLAGGFVLGRSMSQPATKAPPRPVLVAKAPEPAPPTLPIVQPPLGRAELIAAAARAADAFAAGGALPQELAALAGREFTLRLPFGCPGALETATPTLSWRYDEADEALRLRAEPVRWTALEWLPAQAVEIAGSAPAEAVEGFWITRPWMSSDACPAAPDASTSAPVPATPETLGIAQFFAAEASRIGRRNGKAFQTVEKIAPGAFDVTRGFRLRLHGRVAAAPNGAPILCRTEVPGSRPVCLISVALDEVAFENPVDGTTLATWDVSSQTGRKSST